MESGTDHDLACVARVWDPMEAEIIVAKLRAAGIPAIIRHDALSTVIGITVDGAGKQEVLVDPADLEAADAVVAPAAEEAEDEGPASADATPD